MMQTVDISSPSAKLSFAPRPGNIAALQFTFGGREIQPLHRAPWADDAPEAGPVVERHLSGDFFCAPFGPCDVEDGPPHGWTANGEWQSLEAAAGLRFILDRPVMGARIEKRLHLAENAPILYQEHVISGGSGGLPVAHHPMIRAQSGATLSMSPKRVLMTGGAPPEPGRAALAYPAQVDDLRAFPGADGSPVDLGRLPIGRRSEDIVLAVEAPGNPLGWSAVLREAEDDIVFVLKKPSVLPVTVFWHSNGGRDYAPWNGRHDRVIGIEDGCNAGTDGHAAALSPNPVLALGVPTSLELSSGGRHRIPHALGVIPRPNSWTHVSDIRLDGDRLVLTGTGGDSRDLPFEADFFTRSI